MNTACFYGANYLATRLRAASVGHEQARFAELLDGRTVSYGEMFAAAERIATALIAAGVQPGERVALQVEKSLEAVQVYLGTLLAGGVFLPFNPAYTAAEMSYFLSDSQPSVLICDPRAMESLRPIAAQVGIRASFSLAADGSGSLRTHVADTSAANPSTINALGNFTAVARGQDDLAVILYTSGTTGRSKGAMMSHGNLAANADTVTDYWEFTTADNLIHALPIFHTHGLLVAINSTFMAASSLIFMRNFDADEIVNAMQRATVLMGVPTFYIRLLAHPGVAAQSTNRMRLFIAGSAPLSAETHHQWRAKTGHAILERYGMTETGMNISNPYIGERRAGTVGLPLPGVEMRITDAATAVAVMPAVQLPAGEVGVIEVRGANVFRGYWRMPDKTREALRTDGFFITGDLGVVDDHGYVSIVGRCGDLIISGGYNVYPREIENAIDGIKGVHECAVIGLPHADFGESVTAIIVADATTGEAHLRAALKDKLANFKQPKQFFFTKQLPRNAMGKVQKNSLRERYGGVG